MTITTYDCGEYKVVFEMSDDCFLIKVVEGNEAHIAMANIKTSTGRIHALSRYNQLQWVIVEGKKVKCSTNFSRIDFRKIVRWNIPEINAIFDSCGVICPQAHDIYFRDNWHRNIQSMAGRILTTITRYIKSAKNNWSRDLNVSIVQLNQSLGALTDLWVFLKLNGYYTRLIREEQAPLKMPKRRVEKALRNYPAALEIAFLFGTFMETAEGVNLAIKRVEWQGPENLAPLDQIIKQHSLIISAARKFLRFAKFAADETENDAASGLVWLTYPVAKRQRVHE
jgi:hypothetical protein